MFCFLSKSSFPLVSCCYCLLPSFHCIYLTPPVPIAVASSADYAKGAHWRVLWLCLQLPALQPVPKREGQRRLAQWRRTIAGKKSHHCLAQLWRYPDLWDEEETLPRECSYRSERVQTHLFSPFPLFRELNNYKHLVMLVTSGNTHKVLGNKCRNQKNLLHGTWYYQGRNVTTLITCSNEVLQWNCNLLFCPDKVLSHYLKSVMSEGSFHYLNEP